MSNVEAIITTHPAAGIYWPHTPGARTLAAVSPLMVQGARVSAVVDPDGTYTLFVGGGVIYNGVLPVGQANLMSFFAEAALLWSDQVDNERAEIAAEQQAAFLGM